MGVEGWQGPRKGPCTTGEARTLSAVISGVEPGEVVAFVNIIVLKCDDCGEPHNLIVNQDLKPAATLQVLTTAMSDIVLSLE